MKKIYVKKIWSTDPDLYRKIELNEALKQYHAWAEHCINATVYTRYAVGNKYTKQTTETKISADTHALKPITFKSFEEWLKTEI